jgi:peptidoglycan/LPS O-acetylase OafA/YrhL
VCNGMRLAHHHYSNLKMFDPMRLNISSRITFLDGLRGISIVAVILFHALGRYPDLLPYGGKFSGIPLIKYGWLGVELFFVISGFVILMTLEKSSSFRDFMLRRWFRLFPAMLACSAFIFITAPLFPERPAGQPKLINLLPGLTFINYGWGWLQESLSPLESAFWSLFVEVKFYIVFGISYFMAGRVVAIWVLLVFFTLAHLTPVVMPLVSELGVLWRLTQYITYNIGAQHFGWFAAGALFYQYFVQRRVRYFISALMVASVAAFTVRDPVLKESVPILAPLIVIVLFVAALISERFKIFLSSRVLLWLGFISYPLYLLHENIMVALIIKIGRLSQWIPLILLPVFPIGVVIFLGWIIAAKVEGALQERLRRPYIFFRRLLRIKDTFPVSAEQPKAERG